jgi:hypothetical protein
MSPIVTVGRNDSATPILTQLDVRISRVVAGQEQKTATPPTLLHGVLRIARSSVVALTGANERAVRNWFDAKNGPSGEFLIALCRHSDQVLETFLLLAGRTEHVKARKVVEAKQKLREILALVDELEG